MQATQIMAFAPQTKLQTKQLLQYVEANRPAINLRKTAEYTEAVKYVREILAAYFKVNPPQLKVKLDPWVITGASNMTAIIAEKYSVPIWDIYAEANPY